MGWEGGEQISVESLSVTQNGTYTAPTGTAYSPVVVDVQEQPWQPLQDGYSNFWFELTDDTLSPWLNFSAKNNDAVIDWGDGSGEVALDTLTPTHTYAKAGRYVVKCKGVTGIAQRITLPTKPDAMASLQYIECNNEIIDIATNSLRYNVGLRAIVTNNIMNFGGNAFIGCALLKEIDLSSSSFDTLRSYAFAYCSSLSKVTLPNTVQNINSYAMYLCVNLTEIHIQATTPPTLGSNAISGLPNDFIIYVPQGTGETYKSAAGWSAYSEHILEEGQTVTRAMQRKFAKEAKAIEENGEEVSR